MLQYADMGSVTCTHTHTNAFKSDSVSDTCICAFSHKSNSGMLFSPHQPAGQRVAACLTAHCAYLRHLPWLLDVGGGEGLQQGREDPNGNQG